VRKLVLMLAMSLAAAGVANADINKHDFGDTRANIHQAVTASTSAPEIDPAGMLSGLTLLAGGLAVLRGRRRK
jgi:LPXTG-motif cell wall-anchored protein